MTSISTLGMSIRLVLLNSPPVVPPFSRENVFGRFLVALTAKQRKFAWLVASGVSKTASYAQVYDGGGNRNTQGKNGHVLSKQPAVAAAIAEYEARLLPLADVRGEKLTAVRNIKMLALSPNVNAKIRLKASVTLYKICAEHERVEGQELSNGQRLDLDHLIDQILQELRRAEEAQGLLLEKSHDGRPLATKGLKTGT